MELFQFYPEMGLFQPIVIDLMIIIGITSFVFAAAITFSKRCKKMWIGVLKKIFYK